MIRITKQYVVSVSADFPDGAPDKEAEAMLDHHVKTCVGYIPIVHQFFIPGSASVSQGPVTARMKMTIDAKEGGGVSIDVEESPNGVSTIIVIKDGKSDVLVDPDAQGIRIVRVDPGPRG